MSTAIELIVDGYVRLNNRKALGDLLAQRRRLANDLRMRGGFDFSKTIRQIAEEIDAIEAGLARLESQDESSK